MKTNIAFIILFWLAAGFSLFGQNINSGFEHNGLPRTYIVHLPPAYTPNSQMPLVLVLHGLGDSGNGIMMGTGFNMAADTAGFIAVYPDAADALFGAAAWNSGANPFGSADDVGFISALIDTMYAQYHIDLNRIYATGFSMGGIMSHRLGCELSNRIAAIASGSGTFATTVIGNCSPGKAVPVMQVHGTADAVVPFDGNALLGLQSVGATINFWAANNNCALTAPASTPIPNTANDGITIDKTKYDLCTNNSEVILYTATGMEHTWLQPNNDMCQTAEIWKFFLRHQLNEQTVGTTPVQPAPALQYYPNPAKDNLTVMVNLPNAQYLKLLNLAGQTVYQQVLTGNDQMVRIHTFNFIPGLYLLQIQQANRLHTVKIQIGQ
ncbi:T9SS C-terminal target domain-containing protein [Sphingobacteriales bacterium UPWRP_1]|nr:hypothetical protein BVG80_10920 [Sphingobacteriales bacterium TSM_CSM]PSJ77431.1 T9SS C-terminal target domain-containing protein [Sphingobacteriales bacterium UPWRP_1]